MIKNSYFILLLVSLIFLKKGYANDYGVDRIPTALKSRASAVLRHESVQIDMKTPRSMTQTVHRVITVLNKSGDQYADLLLYYDKTKSIKDVKGVIYDEFGQQSGKFSMKDLKDYSATSGFSLYEDIRVKHFSPRIITYPYTVEYTYEVKHSQNLFIPYWRPNFASDLAVENSTYRFVCNTGEKLRIKTQNVDPPTEDSNEKSQTYTWTAKNIQAKKAIPFAPISDNGEMLVKVVPENFQYFKRQGTVQDWQQFGKWVFDELLKDKQDLPQETAQKVRELTAGLPSTREKAKAIYEYMQSRTRYISIQIGIGGLEPFPASYVDRLGYGDCKALVNYMQSLLSAADINSLYCIVEAGNKKISLDEQFANAVDGNHIILCVPLEKDSIWLECTNNQSPFNFLGDFTDDRLVLACTSNGGEVLKTPTYDHHNSIQHRKAVLSLDRDGTVHGQVKTLFSGAQLDNHFQNLLSSPTERIQNLKKYYDINEISFSEINYTMQDSTSPTLHEDLTISIRNHVTRNGKQFILSPNVFNTTGNIMDSPQRSDDIYINRGYTDIDELEFLLPENLQENIVPTTKTIDSPMGKYSLQISSDSNKIQVSRKMQLFHGTYPAAAYQQFYDFMKEISSLDRIKYNLAFEKQ